MENFKENLKKYEKFLKIKIPDYAVSTVYLTVIISLCSGIIISYFLSIIFGMIITELIIDDPKVCDFEDHLLSTLTICPAIGFMALLTIIIIIIIFICIIALIIVISMYIIWKYRLYKQNLKNMQQLRKENEYNEI